MSSSIITSSVNESRNTVPMSGKVGGSRRWPTVADGGTVPPASNTGALMHPAETKVDWLEYTIPLTCENDIDYWLKWHTDSFHGAVRLERGLHGYKTSHSVLGSGLLMYHRDRLEMGFHVSLPSSALGTLCDLYGDTAIYKLLISLRPASMRPTRIDICADTTQVHIDTVIEAVESGMLVSPAQSVRLVRELKKETGGATIYIGSPSSDRMVRIYDKAAEQGTDGVWTRLEIQYRKKYAGQIVDLLLLSDVSLETLASTSVDFREMDATRTNNRTRCEWWEAWVGAYGVVTLVVQKVAKRIDTSVQWIEDYVSRTLAMCMIAKGWEWLERTIDRGVRDMSQLQIALATTST